MEFPEINPGNVVRVTTKIKEGEKTRLQIFEGIVISIRGEGTGKTFTVRKISAGGIGVERIWPFNSPSLQKIEIRKATTAKRAKLYYLRNRIGKLAKKV